MGITREGVALIAASALMLGFAAGFLFGYIGLKGNTQSIFQSLTQHADESITQKIISEINANNIRNNLRELTSKPHLAGTPADYEQAEMLRSLWEEQGLTSWLESYEILLSYPDEDAEPSRIELQDDSTGAVLFTTQLAEKTLHEDQNQSDVVPPFNAFSAAGSPKGSLVYVNYGRIQDFTWLKEEKNIDFDGKICIARYGKIFRGDKAYNAEKFGAAGLIMYTDPQDYAARDANTVFPDSWWLPDSGVQRGSLNLLGDPLTPGYPSIESAFRIKKEEAGLLTIPVHPISYGDALQLLQNMTGEEAPIDWQGDLPITYRLGPGFQEDQWEVQMKITTKTKKVTTYNAFGMINGELEPDRYVLLGNHRDAWVFGALDPSSGTAAMMELSRALAVLNIQGWKPRRSILFCSWGAEEHGLIGSKEWVEQHTALLTERAVAYLNVDIAIQGEFALRAKGLPLIKNVLYEVGKKIPNPDQKEIDAGRKTVYDTWKIRYPEIDEKSNSFTGLPKVPILGSGSDYEPFISKVGVTCVDLRYNYDESLGISSYPLYHSVYETFHLVNNIMDPDFLYHKAVTQYWAELARTLADDYILPFDTSEYVASLNKFKISLWSQYEELMVENGLQQQLDYLERALNEMQESSDIFQQRLENVDENNPLEVRMLNDQLMNLERAFINPHGLPGRPFTKNVIFAPSQHDSYSGSSFPGVVDTLFEIEKLKEDEAAQRWKDVEKQLSVVTYHIKTAASVLRGWNDFKYQ